jgi:hypothetical protein
LAIAAQNLSFLTSGPAFTGQQLAASANSTLEDVLEGLVTFVGDGTSTTATLNYIDGTQALASVPKAVTVQNTSSADAVYATDTGTGVAATVTFATAPASGANIKLYVKILL